MINKIRHIFVEEIFNELQSLKKELAVGSSFQMAKQTVEKVHRTMHTINGSAPMFGYNHLTEIALPVETVYRKLCDGRIELSNLIIDKTKDVVSLILEVLSSENDRLQSFDKDEQMLIHFFNNIDGLNVRAHD